MFYFSDENSLTVYFKDGNGATWMKKDPDFNRILRLAKEEDWIKIQALHNQAKTVLNSEVLVGKDEVTVGKDENKIKLSKDNKIAKFLRLLKEKGVIDTRIEEIKPFLKKMFQNQHIDAVTELYDWCTAMDFEITKDGNFLAYKKVRKDLGSIHDNGATKHEIGKYTTVDDFCTDRTVTCSRGLHFCSKEYLSNYGLSSSEVTLIVEIDPRDVVSIPVDYNNQKGRCCRYKPIGIIKDDETLQTTDIGKMTKGEVQTVKTKEQRKIDKNKTKVKALDRISQTVKLMKKYKNDAEKVAYEMGITVSTVKRNMQKAKARG